MNAITNAAQALRDGFQNLVSSLGGRGDKNLSNTLAIPVISQGEIEAAYRTGWFGKIVDIPPADMTREWREWQAEDDQIEKIEAEEKRLDVQRKVRTLLQWGRAYGGAALLIGDGSPNPERELNPETIEAGGIQYLHVLSRYEIGRSVEIDRDPASPFFGQPKRYTLNNPDGSQVEIHPSRVVRYIGRVLPSFSVIPTTDGMDGLGWGDSLWTLLRDAILNTELTSSGIASLVHEAKIDVVKVNGFMSNISTTTYEEKMRRRFGTAAQLKSINNVLLLDKEDEWEQKQLNFSQLPEVLKTYLMVMAGIADIPATRLLGKAPDGMNSTGDSDLRNYYDSLASFQKTDLSAILSPLDEMLIRSALGERPEEIHFNWRTLWQPSAAELSEIQKRNAERDKIYVETNALPPTAMAKAIQNSLVEDGVYPGLEAALDEAEAAQELPMLAEQITPEEELAAEAEAREAQERSGARPPARNAKPALRVVGKDGTLQTITDATPRTLYVSRQLMNAADLISWARAQGFKTTVPADQMHVTLAFSREPVDWMKVGEDWSSEPGGRLTIEAGGPRLVEPLGPNGAVVLMFSSWRLSMRHGDIRRAGASWDWPEYQPHVTITFDAGGMDLREVEPYRGRLVFGPEIFAELDDNWKAGITEVPTNG